MKGAPPAEDGFYVAKAEGQPLLQLEVGEHLRIALLVAAQELLGLGLGEPRLPRQPLGAHAVDHAEVDRLAQPPLLAAHLLLVQ